MSALDTQEGGNHYKDMKIQPIEFIVANDIPYREGNVIKYICRHRKKNKAEDIRKVIHYAQMILEEYEQFEKEEQQYEIDLIDKWKQELWDRFVKGKA